MTRTWGAAPISSMQAVRSWPAMTSAALAGLVAIRPRPAQAIPALEDRAENGRADEAAEKARSEVEASGKGQRRQDSLPPSKLSEVNLLGKDERVVDFDTEVSHCALEFRVPEQQLTGPDIAGAFVDERHLRSPQTVGPVICGVEADQSYPTINEPAVFARAHVIAVSGSAWKKPVAPS